MNNVKILPHTKSKKVILINKSNATDKNGNINGAEKIHLMEKKLEDPDYIDAAIYRLASILTDRVLNGGFDYEKEKI